MNNDKIKVTRYQAAKEPGTYVASLSIIVPKWGNYYINRIKLFQKNGHFWIKFPDEKYEKDGETKYFPYSGFENKEIHEKFQKQVLTAIDEYVKENNKKSHASNVSDDEEAPF